MKRYDIAIIGTGPAGLSAAITAKIRNKEILLLGSRNLSDKVQKAHEIQNYLGLPQTSGKDLAQSFEKHIEQMGIVVTEEKAIVAYSMGDYFAIQTDKENYEADTVILAGGVTTQKPLPGEEEFLGRGVSYCATCDAPLYRGRKVLVVGYDREAEEEANFLSEIAEQVIYIPVYKMPSVDHGEENLKTVEKVEVIQAKPLEIQGAMKADQLLTDKGKYEADGIFVLRESIAPKQLIPGLLMEGSHVSVNLQMETNLPGCFACGDITGKPYQYIKSAGQGNVAALSAAAYLDQIKKRESHG